MPKSPYRLQAPTNGERCHLQFVDGQVEHHNFGALDRLGRRIGARVKRFTARYFLGAPGAGPYHVAPGDYLAFIPHATRNEEVYGASQPTEYFATSEDREARIAAYLAGARKRAGGAP